MIAQSVLKSGQRVKQCTGLEFDKFKALALNLEPLWEEAERKRLSRPNRERKIGGGRRYELKSIEEKLFCLLMWYKLYPPYWLLGMLVGLDSSNTYRLLDKLRPLLAKTADPQLGKRLRRGQGKRVTSLKQLKEEYPDIYEILIDATEQERQRPKKQVQKRYYSGKKKRHTLKTQITVNTKGRILEVSKSYPGSIHDYMVFKKEETADKLPKQTQVHFDRGYTGVEKDYSNLEVHIPTKKSRWKRELTRSEKIQNRKKGRKRVLVEHILSRIKKYQVLAQIYRHRVRNYNQDFKNVAALINYRRRFVT